jgi:hypothetical protein
MANIRKRQFLKKLFLGTSLVGICGIGLFSASQTQLLTPKPRGQKTNLLIDPDGKNFVYINGFVVKA